MADRSAATATSAVVPATNRTNLGLALRFLRVLAFSLTLPMTHIALGGLDAAQVAVWRGIVAALLAGVILVTVRPPGRRGASGASSRSAPSVWCSASPSLRR